MPVSSRPAMDLLGTRQPMVVSLLLEQPQEESIHGRITELSCIAIIQVNQVRSGIEKGCGNHGKNQEGLR